LGFASLQNPSYGYVIGFLQACKTLPMGMLLGFCKLAKPFLWVLLLAALLALLALLALRKPKLAKPKPFLYNYGRVYEEP
jgi:hypothetical protein